jgi:hypothetical protein
LAACHGTIRSGQVRGSLATLGGGSDKDELYGNLGQDFVAGFESFTLDFSKMIFSLGPPLNALDTIYH